MTTRGIIAALAVAIATPAAAVASPASDIANLKRQVAALTTRVHDLEVQQGFDHREVADLDARVTGIVGRLRTCFGGAHQAPYGWVALIQPVCLDRNGTPTLNLFGGTVNG